jgi:hypothetical protein
MASGFCSAPLTQRPGHAIRSREAHRARTRASRAAKCAEFSGLSKAPIFAGVICSLNKCLSPPRRLQCAGDDW